MPLQEFVGSAETIDSREVLLNLYRTALIYGFIEELQFKLSSSEGRATARADVTDKVLEFAKDQVGELISSLPVPGMGVIKASINYAVDLGNDARKEAKTSYAVLLAYLAEPDKLYAILEPVAMEAARCYQYFIIHSLSEEPIKGVIPFAKAGVSRMLEYVLQNELPLSVEHLLRGLFAGPERIYDVANTPVVVCKESKNDAYKGIKSKVKSWVGLGGYTAEGAYRRSGLQTLSAPMSHGESRTRGELWVLKDKKKFKQESSKENGTSKHVYTNLIESEDPKYGYMHVSRMFRDSMYGHLDESVTRQDFKNLSSALQERLNLYKPLWATITKKELIDYLSKKGQEPGLSLLEYTRNLDPSYALIKQVIYQADLNLDEWDLSALHLNGADFSHCVFNHCIFGGSLNATRWCQSSLFGAYFNSGTSVQQADFTGANLKFATAQQVNFSGSNFTQAQLQYADFQGADLTNIKDRGAVWTKVLLSDTKTHEQESIIAVQQRQGRLAQEHAASFLELVREQYKQSYPIPEGKQHLIGLLEADLRKLKEGDLSKSPRAAVSADDKPSSEIDSLAGLVTVLLQEQEATRSLVHYCRAESLRLSQQTELMQLKEGQYTDQLASLKQTMESIQEKQNAYTPMLEQVHALCERVSHHEIELEELGKQLEQLGEGLYTELGTLARRLSSVENLVTQFKYETLPELIQSMKTQDEHAFQTMETLQADFVSIPLLTQNSKFRNVAPQKLDEVINEFLFADSRSKERVCIVLGVPGSGKSDFCSKLRDEIRKRAASSPGDSSPIPIYINLRRYTPANVEHCVERTLNNKYSFSQAAIRLLKESKHKFVFIIDGEVDGSGIANPYSESGLDSWGNNSKTILIFRPDDEPYREVLLPKNNNGVPVNVYHILPLTMFQISDYLNESVQKNKISEKTKTEYLHTISRMPGFSDVITTVRLLLMSIDAYPLLIQKGTRFLCVDLYENFMRAWFEREAQELSGPSRESAVRDSLTNARSLAFALFETGATEASNWEGFFMHKENTKDQARRACPLYWGKNTPYSFIHKSLLAYFIADSLWDAVVENRPDPARKWGARCLTKDLPKMPEIIRFLAERVYTHPQRTKVINLLLEFIRASKRSLTEGVESSQLAFIKNAASNAMTVLIGAGVSLAEIELTTPGYFETIQIPYANLSGAQLPRVNLSGADLTGVLLAGADLSDAKLDRCILTDVNVKQFPMLLVETPIDCIAYSKDGAWMAVAMDKRIKLYKQSRLHWKFSRELSGHTEPVTSLVFSPESIQLASGSKDSTIRLWKLLDGAVEEVLAWHQAAVTCVIYSPNGEMLASAGKDHKIQIWDVNSNTKIPLTMHTDKVTSIAFSSTGQKLVSGSNDGSIVLWDVQTKEYRSLKKGIGKVYGVGFSPDGTQIVSWGKDRMIRLWGVNGNEGPKWEGNTGRINSVIFSLDGQQLVSAGDDKTIRFWDGKTGAPGPVFEGHTDKVTCLVFSLDGKHLFSGSYDSTIRIWEVENFEVPHSDLVPLSEGHTDVVNSVNFSSSGDEVVTGSADNTIRVWPTDGSAPRFLEFLAKAEDSITCVVPSPNTPVLFTASSDKTLRVWSIEGKLVSEIPDLGSIVTSLACSSKGQLAVVHGSTVDLWDPIKKSLIESINPELFSSVQRPTKSSGRTRGDSVSKIKGVNPLRINCVTYSPSGGKLAFGNSNGNLVVYDINGPQASVLLGHTDAVSSVAFLGEEQVITGGYDKTVRRWQSQEKGESGFILGAHAEAVLSVACSPSSNLIASGGGDKKIFLWNGDTLIVSLECKDVVTSLAFSPNGQRLVSGSRDYSVQYWAVDASVVTASKVWGLWKKPANNTLKMSHCSVEGVVGISPTNRELFGQLDAQVSSDQVSESVLLISPSQTGSEDSSPPRPASPSALEQESVLRLSDNSNSFFPVRERSPDTTIVQVQIKESPTPSKKTPCCIIL